MRSIRSSSRGRTESQRGIVLIVALVLAILYFMLMTLVMIDSSRAQAEAQRYRARVRAAVMAEDAAEQACAQMVTRDSGLANAQDSSGTLYGTYLRKANDEFEVTGKATARGVPPQDASVSIKGHFQDKNIIKIDWSWHSQ